MITGLYDKNIFSLAVFFFPDIYLFKREEVREHKQGKGRGRRKRKLPPEQRAQGGAQDPGIMHDLSWRQLLYLLSHQGSPKGYFVFLRSHQTFFQSGWTILHSHNMVVSVGPHPHRHLEGSVLDFCHDNRCGSHCFNCISLITHGMEHLFMCLFAIRNQFWLSLHKLCFIMLWKGGCQSFWDLESYEELWMSTEAIVIFKHHNYQWVIVICKASCSSLQLKMSLLSPFKSIYSWVAARHT